jgi:4'-phosphopantetheinyl transferase
MHIDIWLTHYDDIQDAGLLAQFRELLSDEERARQQRFHFADDRKRYLVTRALVRTTLSRYAPVKPAAWTFQTNAYGRPGIAGAHPEAVDISFNLSHTRGLIALAVTRQRALGIDVENLAVREVPPSLADRFFSAAEIAALAALPSERRHYRLFEYWTFKESYVKARSMGLSLPLDRFGFHYPHERAVRLHIDPELGDEPARWGLWQYRPGPDYLLAVCCERGLDESVTLTLRRSVPMRSDEVLRLPVLRSTHAA